MIYSVQQVLFDCMSYMREFEERGELWRIGSVGSAETPLVIDLKSRFDVWIHRKMVSSVAAQTVCKRMSYRLSVAALEENVTDSHIFFGFNSNEPCCNVALNFPIPIQTPFTEVTEGTVIGSANIV